MKVAHVAIVTPNRCGLYETTRELVHAVRKASYNSVDARIVDPCPAENPVYKGAEIMLKSDRGVPIADVEWALTADVIVSHSGYVGTAIETSNQPVVHITHGRPLVSYMGERDRGRNGKNAPLYTYHATLDRQARIKAVVTFWPQHVKYHQVMFVETPVHYVQSMVDLEYWNPAWSHSVPAHDWNVRGGGVSGSPNAVITDGWREDIDPFNAMNAWALWARRNPGGRLHLYGKPQPAPGTDAILVRMLEDGTVGEHRPWVPAEYLRRVYLSADFLLTPHEIDTRAVREAMACGCPVVRVGNDLEFTPPTSPRDVVRRLAEAQFDPAVSAAQFIRILEHVAR